MKPNPRLKLGTTRRREVVVRCPVCKAKATAIVADMRFGAFDGSWVSLPNGWFWAIGADVAGLSRGLVRCPECAPADDGGDPQGMTCGGAEQ